MTTICANLKEMCADSALSWDIDVMIISGKIEVVNHEIVGCAGHEPHIQRFLRWFRAPTPEWPEIDNVDDDDKGFLALVLNDRGLWIYGNSFVPARITEGHAAIGSGALAARAALHHGKSPRVAIETACLYDKNSKLPVERITLKQALRGK